MKLKMFLVFILTFILVPCVGYAEDYVLYYDVVRNNASASGAFVESSIESVWNVLYKGICKEKVQKDVLGSGAQGCNYYWEKEENNSSSGNSSNSSGGGVPYGPNSYPSSGVTSSPNEETEKKNVEIKTYGFSDSSGLGTQNGCVSSSTGSIAGAAGQTTMYNPSDCLNGAPERVELIGFDEMTEFYKLLKFNSCSTLNCFSYFRINYCDNWKSTESLCVELKEFNSKQQNVSDSNIIDGDLTIDSCEKMLGTDTTAGKDLIKLIRIVKDIFFLLVPILVIIFTIIDFTKAVFSGEDAMKKAQGKLFKRLLIAVVIFLIPLLIKIILWFANLVWPFISTDLCGIL